MDRIIWNAEAQRLPATDDTQSPVGVSGVRMKWGKGNPWGESKTEWYWGAEIMNLIFDMVH